MKTQNLTQKSVLLISVLAVLSGCGQTSYKEGTKAGATSDTTTWDPGTTTGGETTTTTPDGVIKSRAYTFQIKGAGSGTTSFSQVVTTDSILKITIEAGDIYKLPGTGYDIGFNCQQYQVTALGSTEEVFVTRNGYTPSSQVNMYGQHVDPCYGAVPSKTLDFSELLEAGSGRNVNVVISMGRYDNCRLYGNTKIGGCGPISTVYAPTNGSAPHAINGRLRVQTNTLN